MLYLSVEKYSRAIRCFMIQLDNYPKFNPFTFIIYLIEFVFTLWFYIITFSYTIISSPHYLMLSSLDQQDSLFQVLPSLVLLL